MNAAGLLSSPHVDAPFEEPRDTAGRMYVAWDHRDVFFTFPPHYHNEVELVCTAGNARGTMRIAGAIHRVDGDDFLFIKPGAVHSYAVTADAKSQLLICVLNRSFVDRGLAGLVGRPPEAVQEAVSQIRVSHTREAVHLRECLMRLSGLLPGGIAPQLQGSQAVPEAVSDASALLDIFDAVLRGGAVAGRSEHPDTVRRVIDTIVARFGQHLSLSEIARASFVSRFHMCHAFRAHTGMSVLEYLTHMRIMHAQKLLGETRMPLEQVASECGFASGSYFGKVFVRATGVTPRGWRCGERRIHPQISAD